jgi:nucleoside-diphosphate-sugar epimerase
VSDVARVYIACVEAATERVAGKIFNVVEKNYRVLELAHWVREAFKPMKKVEIEVDYSTDKTRSYRVSGKRVEVELGVRPLVGVKESVERMVKRVQQDGHDDLFHPRYYNIGWMTLLQEMEETLRRIGSVF